MSCNVRYVVRSYSSARHVHAERSERNASFLRTYVLTSSTHFCIPPELLHHTGKAAVVHLSRCRLFVCGSICTVRDEASRTVHSLPTLTALIIAPHHYPFAGNATFFAKALDKHAHQSPTGAAHQRLCPLLWSIHMYVCLCLFVISADSTSRWWHSIEQGL